MGLKYILAKKKVKPRFIPQNKITESDCHLFYYYIWPVNKYKQAKKRYKKVLKQYRTKKHNDTFFFLNYIDPRSTHTLLKIYYISVHCTVTW